MDRNREGRRGNMAAVSGLSRRRPRTSSLRDSPEEDGGVAEMQESSRLRDRGNKKDRDRDRSSRSKRRRGDHVMHGNNREEGEDSTDESIDEEEEDDDDDAGAPVRLSQQPLASNPSSQPGSLPANHNYRKGLSTKVIRPPAVWKVTDDIVGATVPRKARSASGKRSHECWLSGSGGGGGGSGGGGGEQMNRQASTSPSRSSQAATNPAPISPSSSNVSVKKKTKQICSVKNRPPKISKPSSSIQEIEFEVAEVLYGLTRQFQAPSKQEGLMPDSKDVNGSCGEAKSRASSPNATLPSAAVSECPTLAPQGLAASAAASSPSPVVAAPKRKKPRPMKHEDEIPASPPNPPVLPTVLVSATSKAAEGDLPKIVQTPSPKSEKTAPAPAPEDGVASPGLRSHQLVEAASVQEESKKSDVTVASDIKSPVLQSESHERDEMNHEPSASPKENASRLDYNETASAATKTASAAEFPREKFKIDLMAPPGKSSPERESDFGVDNKPPLPDVEMGPKIEPVRTDEENHDRTIKQGTRDGWREEKGGGDKGSNEGLNEGKPVKKEASLDLLLEIEKHDRDGGAVGKQTGMRQQPKAPRAESKPDKIAQAGSVPLPVHVPGWPGGLPFGYMGQVPSLQPMVPVDGGSTVAKALQAQQFLSQQLRPKRCATHCYIAHNIYYHQQLARINPFWPAAAGSTSLYGAKPYNLNVVPASDSAAILGDPLQGGFPGRGLSATQDKGAPGGSFPGSNSREKGATTSFMDAAQRKQLVLQQPLPAGPANSMMPPPTLIFPLNQTHAAVAAAGGTSRASHVKATNMSAVASSVNDSGAASSGSVAAPTPAVNFSYANLPQGEAQYLVLQNHGYPFPIPAHVGGPPPYRGAANNQAIPFFSGSMYASQMLHPSQLQQQAQAQAQALHPSPTQQGTPNASAPTVSSSSQKHSQNPHKAAGGGPDVPAHGLAPLKQRQSLQPHHQQARQPECETGSEDCSSSADGRASQSQKGGFYANNFVLPPQAFGVSFASFNGAAAAAAAAAAGHHGLDFSSAAQSHSIFQSLPEMARHGYQLSAPVAAAQAAAQHKKAQQHLHPESGKFLGEALAVNVPGEEERKGLLAGKVSGGMSQHSLSFARPETDPSGSAVAGSNVIDRTLNLIPASVAPSRPASAAPAAAGASSASGDQPNGQHHQQHLIHLQKHHQQQQQQLQLQQQQQQQLLACRAKQAGASNTVGAYSDRMPAGPAMPKFPNALAGFPPAHIHGGGTGQSPQWKNSSRSSSSMPYPAAYTPPVKAHHSQQQQQQQQQSRPHTAAHPNVAAHAQISFGMNSVKSSAAVQQQQQQLAGANSIQPSVSVSSAATSVGSPTSVSKGAGGSPKASNGSKTAPPSGLQQQTLSKGSSVGGASHKSAPASGRNAPSILGQPHGVSSPSSVAKSQQLQQNQQQLQLQKQQQQQQPPPPPQYPAAQIFFTNSYMPTQPPHSGAAASAASAYHQRRHSEQQPQSSAGMLSLCAPALTLTGTATATSDPAKAANNVKGLPSPGLLQAAQFAAAAAHPPSSGTHALMSAAGFSYLHAMSSSMSMKPGEQKPAAGECHLPLNAPLSSPSSSSHLRRER